jgi:hypothetical protein
MKLTETQHRFRQAMTEASRPCPHDQYNTSIEKSILKTVYSARQITIFALGIFFMFLVLNYHVVYGQNSLVGPLYSQAYIKHRILSSNDIFVIHSLIETIEDVEKVAYQIDTYQHLPFDQQDPEPHKKTLENGMITTDRAQRELKLLRRQSSEFLKELFPLADDYVTLVKGAFLNWQPKIIRKNPQMSAKRSAAFLVSAKNKHKQFMVEFKKMQDDLTKSTR